MRVGVGRVVAWAAVGSGLLGAGLTAPAAALEWQPVETLKIVRGFPEPQVAIDGSGKSTVVFSQGLDQSGGDVAKVQLFSRPPGARSDFFEPGLLPGQGDPAVATNPAGAMAIATVDDGRLQATLYPAPGPKASPPWDGPRPAKLAIEGAGPAIGEPQVAIDGAGVATVVWVSPPVPVAYTPVPVESRVYAVKISPPGVVGPIEELGDAGRCLQPRLAANLRGDVAVLARCGPIPGRVFVRPAGGDFGPAESVPGFIWGPSDLTIDGSGKVLAIEAGDRSTSPRDPYDYRVQYSTRLPGGSFGPAARLPLESSAGQLEAASQEDGRTLLAWRSDAGVRYAVWTAGSDLGAAPLVPNTSGANKIGLVAAPSGPGLLSWTETVRHAGALRVRFAVSVMSPAGVAGAVTHIGVPGAIPEFGAPSFAIDEAGRAIGAWEQRCWGGGFAVMMVVRDAPGGNSSGPPCQDFSAPRVAVRPKRAQLVGRALRVRVGCDEDCRLGVRARVLRGGKGKPLATAKARRGQRIVAGGYRTFTLRLTKAQTAKVRAARARGRRVTVKLALPVRDSYGNGAVRRVAVPLRR